MTTRFKVDHSPKNKPGMSLHIFALIDTLCENIIIKEDTDLSALMDECTERNTIVTSPCQCGGKIKMSRFQFDRLQPEDDVICNKCEGY